MTYIYTNVYKYIGKEKYEPTLQCHNDWVDALQAYKDEHEQLYNEYHMEYHITYVEDTDRNDITTIDLREAYND